MKSKCLFNPFYLASMFALLAFLGACKKAATSKHDELYANNGMVIRNVGIWLENQKVKTVNAKIGNSSHDSKNKNIDLLERNLDFENVKIENMGQKGSYITIPIKDSVIEQKQLNKNQSLTGRILLTL